MCFQQKKKETKGCIFLKNFLVISNQSIKITFETLTINLDKSCHIAADVLYAEFRHICKKKLSYQQKPSSRKLVDFS